jgi:outer membrane protein assembly factor BamB
VKTLSHWFKLFAIALIASGLLSACSGGSSTHSTLPPIIPQKTIISPKAITGATGDILAINAGGAATGGFLADQDYSSGAWTYAVTNAINTSGVTNPAPQAVYQTERESKTISYSIPGLTAGTAYTVRLDFAELWWTAAGQRVFNVTINGTKVLNNFDVFATAGARYKAVAETFTTTANSTGTIVIALNATIDNAAIDGIEIASGSGTPTPSPTSTPTTAPTPSGNLLAINSGGPANGTFVSDEDYAANSSWTYAVTNAINTTGVTNPAPQGVYQTEREGPTITYTIPGLTSGALYTVRLDFSELWWTAAGQRVFNVTINGTKVLSNFDIYATAGAKFKAVAESFPATATSTGTIVIALSAITNNAAIGGIEISGSGTATPTPVPSGTPSFNDYTTYGYDNQRDVFNPNTTAITPTSIANLHLAWQASLGDYNTQTQPILATEVPGHAGVLFVGGGSGNVYGYDALTGSKIWTTFTSQETYSPCGGISYLGIGGTVAYDPASKSLYVVGNSNPSLDSYAAGTLYHLDATTGSTLGHVNFTPTAAGANEIDFARTAVALSNGTAYVGTGSTCDISSWRGRVAAISVPSMSLANTFFTLWDPNNLRGQGAQPWGGGGIWGWGGVALDPSGNVLTGVGNADPGDTGNGTISTPFAAAPTEYSGYAETLLELSSNLSTVQANNHPIPVNTYNSQANDLDVQGTPLVLTPNGTGCGPMVVIQGKSGELSLYNENQINSGPVAQYQLSPLTAAANDAYLGDPAYSSATGLIYAPVASSVNPNLIPPGLIAINPGCGSPSVTWHASFGTDSSGSGISRAVPAVSAGGVVFAGTVNGGGGSVWAVNASTGAVLNGGTPLLSTSGNLRVPPTIDGNWVFVLDNNGNLYGLTIDPSYPTIQARHRTADSRQITHFPNRP